MTCICGSARTNRVGEIMVPNVKTRKVMVYRFALDCPVHGIKVLEGEDRSEPIVTEATDRAEERKQARRARRRRKLEGASDG